MTQPASFHREILAPEECVALLGAAPIARVLISVRCLPGALPVFLHVAPGRVMLASVEDAVIEAARRGDVLGVQLDGAENDGSIWSVQVTGSSRLGEVASLPAAGKSDRLLEAIEGGATMVEIPMTVIHGERIQWSSPV